MPSRRLTIDVSDGTRLEAEVAQPAVSAGASSLAVLAHPHPLYGGSMDAGLIDELFRLLPEHGIGALRFNFRGVGASTGRHDEGRAERLDVAAAVDVASAEGGAGVTVFLCGWSFGADMSLTVGDSRHSGWVCVAPPLRLVPLHEMVAPSDERPKLLLVPEHDQFRPPASAIEATADWTTTKVVTLAGADHFMSGKAREAAQRVAEFAASLVG
jgi:alpha/beta superfamily hydrolase